MSDNYHHDGDGISSTIDQLVTDLQDYNDNIVKLVTMINTINESSSWKDDLVKTEFITTAERYIDMYKRYANTLASFITYLINKNNEASALESAYS